MKSLLTRHPRVTLRLRIIKIKGSEHRLVENVSVVVGSQMLKLAVSHSEWVILHLDSENETIRFQTVFDTVSCECREIDGRKRLDFSKHLSMLIEGYWCLNAPVLSVVNADISSVTQRTRECEIHFQATAGSDGYKPLDEFPHQLSPKFGLEETSASLSLGRCFSPSPVSKALEWMNDSAMKMSDLYPPLDPNRARTHFNPKQPDPTCRIRWEPSVTAMSDSVPVDSVGLTGLIKSVQISQRLDTVFML